MKRGWKILLGTAAFSGICAGALPFLHFKARRAVEVYKRQLVAQGEKLTITELVPASSISGNKQGREFLEKAKPFSDFGRTLFPPPMQMISPGRAMVSWRANAIDDVSWSQLQRDVEANAQATAALRAASEGGELIFPMELGLGYRSPFQRPGPMRQAANWLAMATIFQLHEGKKVEAGENLKAMLRSIENYKGEPSMLSQFQRTASVQIAFNTTWEALQYPAWSDRELEELQKGWNAVKFESAEGFFAIALANGSRPFEEARKSPEGAASISARGTSTSLVDDLTDFAAGVTTDPGAAFKTLMNRPNQRVWRWVVSYEEELFTLKLWHSGLEAARTMEQRGYLLPGLKELDANLEAMGSYEGYLMGDTRTLVRNSLVRLGSARIARQLALTACALQRSKRQTGRYPGTLKELVPQYLAEIPLDPVDGAAVRYRPNANGSFLLYSVGDNGVDDGGDPALRENADPGGTSSRRMRWSYVSRGRDWVWPQPATKSEIQKWKEEETKRVR